MSEQEREDATVEREEGDRPAQDEQAAPGSGDVDEEALEEGLDKLDQAGGGH